MKRITAVALLVLLTAPTPASALAGDKAAYVAGTIARFNMPSMHLSSSTTSQSAISSSVRTRLVDAGYAFHGLFTGIRIPVAGFCGLPGLA